MHDFLPTSLNQPVSQKTGKANSKSIDAVDQLVLILPQRPKAETWRGIPQGGRLKTAFARRRKGDIPALLTRLHNRRQTLVVAATVSADTSPFELLSISRKLVAAACGEKPGILGILVAGMPADDTDNCYRSVCAAALAAGFSLPHFKRKSAPPSIRSIRLLGADTNINLDRIMAEARGNNLARWLTALPPNKLDAANYATMIRELAKDNRWQYKRYSRKDLEKLGAGAFLAVAQGNDDDSASIVRLRYRPGNGSSSPNLSLVGKGIVFDTGGINLKPFRSMLDMHGDMQGSAVALGTLLAISDLQLPFAVDCWLPITENRIGPKAYKSQDVITAANGMTIQTVHTDAEGRMVLADSLTLACREKPQLVIDYATLTGAVINAITNRYSGVFTNRIHWHPRLKRTGQDCGERVWPFPVGKEFLSDLKSETADIMQCSPDGSGDHILAGSFLAEFIENDVPWVHVDLAASNRKGGLAHVPTEITGFGVRFTLSLLLDEQILQAQ